jgi:Domain of unknown function (DUF222)
VAANATYPAPPPGSPAVDAWPDGLYLLVPGPLSGLGSSPQDVPEADELPGAQPSCPEVFKAGRWDRADGRGTGFASGGVGDDLPPGPTLAVLAGDAWDRGLERLSDDELIGVLRAARRLTSWAAAMELAAAGDLWRRRVDEEEAGDAGAAEQAGDELAAALTLTGRSADGLLDLAVSLRRLPATSAALAGGDIDVPKAMVIAQELAGLTDAHAAAIERAVIGGAPGQTTGQLRAATRHAVLAADPDAARRRKEQALREARVERWTEPAGTAALAGRDLPPAAVLAADANLTALANQLKAAGAEGTLDALRAAIYLALLSGTPVSSLLPAGMGHSDASAANPSSSDHPNDGSPGAASPSTFLGLGGLGLGGVSGRVNLTLPLATWLGQSNSPGHVAGYGPVDATDSRDLADALAAHTNTRWCITITDDRGAPVAHGCARPRPAPGRRRAPPAGRSPDQAATRSPTVGAPGKSAAQPPATWTFTISLLEREGCSHARQTAAYQPSPALRHLIEVRQVTCTFPGCRRPAIRCDKDHTVPYHRGGRTCECNLAPLCRRHHAAKQARGWTLEQTSPGVMTWTTPAGRRYIVRSTRYPG